MPAISVFDIIKIGVGPSSSHTVGPWKAARAFLDECKVLAPLSSVKKIEVHLYGSLAKTGKGHGTDIAVMMGLSGKEVETVDTQKIGKWIEEISQQESIKLLGEMDVPFSPSENIHFHFQETLPFHPNGMRFEIEIPGKTITETYFSIGGGFICKENEVSHGIDEVVLPHPIDFADELKGHCSSQAKEVWEIVMQNEQAWRSVHEIQQQLNRIWEEMRACVYRGCHTEGILPGGLEVVRRAPKLNQKLLEKNTLTQEAWEKALCNIQVDFRTVLKWVSCFALAVNEENAAFGRVITAPTNGAAGVIPAVMMYMEFFCKDKANDSVERFLLVAGEIGSIFKKGATISAALGGCQAEIGVSSAMAAAGLTACLGGNTGQILTAAEIAMEHHLGLTCDPIGGLVQIPCIERNSMGAIKAITAAHIALESNPMDTKVSLDEVVRTMHETALDMNAKYKETSEGGLAVNISVNVAEC